MKTLIAYVKRGNKVNLYNKNDYATLEIDWDGEYLITVNDKYQVSFAKKKDLKAYLKNNKFKS